LALLRTLDITVPTDGLRSEWKVGHTEVVGEIGWQVVFVIDNPLRVDAADKLAGLSGYSHVHVSLPGTQRALPVLRKSLCDLL